MKPPALDYHGSLGPLKEACRIAGILYAGDLMCFCRSSGPAAVLLRKADVAYRHFRFAVRVLCAGRNRTILVRDFSNIPLALIFPLLRPFRARLLFIVNHNLQWALNRPLERAAFRLLGRLGCRFVFFEIIPQDGLRRIGMNAHNCCTLPHPVPSVEYRRASCHGICTAGIPGEYRPEKGTDELIRILLTLPLKKLRVCVPNAAVFRRRSPFAAHPDVEVVDTASPADYRQAVAACDVIVLNHPASGYEFRASGLIADAAAAQVPVIVPELPVLEAQISLPVSVGECFKTSGRLADAFMKTDQNLRAGTYRFEDYARARTPAALAERLRSMTGGDHG